MREPGLFPLDVFLTDSTYIRASLFYPLVAATGLRFEHDVVGLPLHLALNAALLAGAVAAVRRRMTGGDGQAALLAVLVSCFFYSKLVDGARATPTSFVTVTPSGLGHVFGMAALFLGLARRPGLAAAAATLCIGLAPKGNLLLLPAMGLWLWLDRSLPRRAMAWILLPAAYVAYQALTSSGAIPPDMKGFMTDAILRREEGDAVFTDQPWPVNLMLPAACLWAAWRGRRSDDPTLRGWLWGLAAATFAGWLAMLVYPRLAPSLPIPMLPMLSIPQATRHLIWLVLTLATAMALSSRRLGGVEKTLAVLALVVLRPTPDRVAAALALAGLARLWLWLRENRGWRRGDGLPHGALVAAGLALLVLGRSGTSYVGPAWIDPVAFAHGGSWSSGVHADEATWRAWESLAPLPDFPLVALYDNRAHGVKGLETASRPGRLAHHGAANIAARKSCFLQLPVHGYTNPPLWLEAQRRELVFATLVQALEQGQALPAEPLGTLPAIKEGLPIAIDSTIEDFLSARRMAILVPAGLEPLFPARLPRRPAGGQVLIGFGLGWEQNRQPD